MADIVREPITDAGAWRADDMRKDTSWIYELERDEIAELEAALTAVNAAGVATTDITAGSFALPHLERRTAQWVRELREGRGFLLVRGIPVDRYSEADAQRIFWGLSTHLGRPISQNAYGDTLGHVRDEGAKLASNEMRGSRGYRGTSSLRFHTDRADVVGLFCLQRALEGGLSCIVSSLTIYNEFLRQHPEYLPALYEGFTFVNSEEDSDGRSWRVPMFTQHQGVVSCRLQRNTIERGRAAGVPFSSDEIAALAFLDELTAREDLRLDMDFHVGDIQFINNFTIMHSRTEYVDDPEPEKKRHLLRIWLQLRERRPLGPYYGEYDGIPKTLVRA